MNSQISFFPWVKVAKNFLFRIFNPTFASHASFIIHQVDSYCLVSPKQIKLEGCIDVGFDTSDSYLNVNSLSHSSKHTRGWSLTSADLMMSPVPQTLHSTHCFRWSQMSPHVGHESQWAPIQPSSHTHSPHSHLPWPLHRSAGAESWLVRRWGGTHCSGLSLQEQESPIHPGSQSHLPHTQRPCPPHTVSEILFRL